MRKPTRLIVPEVVQTSNMDCGPAALKSLLEGFGIPVNYGRLREACQTGVDGTSIDTLEEIANQLGLRAEQIMLPSDHVLIDEAHALPAIAVVVLPNGVTHFVIVWRRFGRFVELMDPAGGTPLGERGALSVRSLSSLGKPSQPRIGAHMRARRIFSHPCAAACMCSVSTTRQPSPPPSLIRAGNRWPLWTPPFACLPRSPIQSAIERGPESARVLEEFLQPRRHHRRSIIGRFVPGEDGQLVMRGAVLVRALGVTSDSPRRPRTYSRIATTLRAPRLRAAAIASRRRRLHSGRHRH